MTMSAEGPTRGADPTPPGGSEASQLRACGGVASANSAMQVREIEITNRHGLHARACARIVHIASRFRCEVSLVSGMRRASARSWRAASARRLSSGGSVPQKLIVTTFIL